MVCIEFSSSAEEGKVCRSYFSSGSYTFSYSLRLLCRKRPSSVIFLSPGRWRDGGRHARRVLVFYYSALFSLVLWVCFAASDLYSSSHFFFLFFSYQFSHFSFYLWSYPCCCSFVYFLFTLTLLQFLSYFLSLIINTSRHYLGFIYSLFLLLFSVSLVPLFSTRRHRWRTVNGHTKQSLILMRFYPCFWHHQYCSSLSNHVFFLSSHPHFWLPSFLLQQLRCVRRRRTTSHYHQVLFLSHDLDVIPFLVIIPVLFSCALTFVDLLCFPCRWRRCGWTF